eukprot:5818188-Karenia_brevis.AAC.1
MASTHDQPSAISKMVCTLCSRQEKEPGAQESKRGGSGKRNSGVEFRLHVYDQSGSRCKQPNNCCKRQ